MNLEEIKSTWEMYDKKIQSTQMIHEKIIESMIRERSHSRISKISTQYRGLFIICGIELFLLIGILAGNPFDFDYGWQYIPYILILAGVIIAMINLVFLYNKLNKAKLHVRVDDFLQNILDYYEKNKKFERWFGAIFLTIGLMVPLSFLPNKIIHRGLNDAVLDTLIMISATLVIYWLAFQFGAFKNPQKDKLRQDLEELKALKGLITDIK